MSKFYNAKRSRNIYQPSGEKPFKLSRSKIDLFIDCPRCFYLDRRLGVGRPPGYPFALNSAVDALLKNEFDALRKTGTKHPLQERYGIDAVPVDHEQLDLWRENFVGIQFHHKPTNFIIMGAIDDLWKNSLEEYIVVDYKSTAKEEKITSLNKDWHNGYKRQMEVYQWLLRQNGYIVSDTGYFVYANGIVGDKSFHAKLEFELTLIPYTGNVGWVEPTLTKIKKTLDQSEAPAASETCDYCAYRDAVAEVLYKKTLF